MSLLGSAHAFGQASSDKATADALFDAARSDMEAGDYAAACPKLAESERLDPGVGTLLNLGKCYEGDGKLASAWSSYREAAALAKREGQLEREELARSESERLEQLLTKVVITVGPELRGVSGLRVEWAGKQLSDAVFDVPFPVDAGEYVLIVSAPGYRSAELKVEALEPGKTFLVSAPGLEREPAALATAVPATSAPQAEAAPKPEPRTHSRGPGAGPFILGGVGLAGVGVGVAFALLGNSENERARAICPDYETSGCSAPEINDWRAHTDTAELNYTVSYVAFGVGGALIVGSATWLILGSGRPKETALRVEPRLGPGAYGLGVRGAF